MNKTFYELSCKLEIHIMVMLGESRLIQNDWETLAEGTTLRLIKKKILKLKY